MPKNLNVAKGCLKTLYFLLLFQPPQTTMKLFISQHIEEAGSLGHIHIDKPSAHWDFFSQQFALPYHSRSESLIGIKRGPEYAKLII